MTDTILVVEDEPFIRFDISEHLTECGFIVLEAGNAAEAIAKIDQRPEINLVFTDVRMPGHMDGIELARWIMTHRPHIAVVIASGDVGKNTAMRDLCGAHAFLKPYRFDEVAAVMRKLLASRQA